MAAVGHAGHRTAAVCLALLAMAVFTSGLKITILNDVPSHFEVSGCCVSCVSVPLLFIHPTRHPLTPFAAMMGQHLSSLARMPPTALHPLPTNMITMIKL